jgi:putative membrane protein
MISSSISTLPSFVAYLAVASAVLGVFLAVYVRFTPYPELALIRDGNAAAAVSLSGTLVGFSLPVASVIRNSRDLVDLAIWSAIACTVQLLTYGIARRALPRLPEDIPAGKLAPAIFLAALSLAVGLVNAACMEY